MKSARKLFDFIANNPSFAPVKTIFEIGARDCAETLLFQQQFPSAQIYTFECNPDTLPVCRQQVKHLDKVLLTEKAVSEIDGEIAFYKIDTQKTTTTWFDGNPGASSLFRASGKYPLENYIQEEITVNSTRMDSFMEQNGVKEIDILWVDVQGAELAVLKSAAKYLKNVKVIHTEVEFFEIYQGQPLFETLKTYLNQQGFYAVQFTTFGKYAADCIFVNKKYLTKKQDILSRCTNQYLRQIEDFKQPYIHLKNRIYARFSKKRLYLDYLKRQELPDFFKEKSQVELDVLILLSAKHTLTLPNVIKGLRDNLLHPIKDIFIVTNIENKDICLANGCIFVDESSILPIESLDILYKVKQTDRKTWLYQQLLKLSADKIGTSEHILICDADLILTQPQAFVTPEGKSILRCSDEYHAPYNVLKKILNIRKRTPVSFVSHHILIKKQRLTEMKAHIEQNHKTSWFKAIIDYTDKTDISGFSEYETYGNYMFYCHRRAISLMYWRNYSLFYSDINQLDDIIKNKKYLSVSVFH